MRNVLTLSAWTRSPTFKPVLNFWFLGLISGPLKLFPFSLQTQGTRMPRFYICLRWQQHQSWQDMRRTVRTHKAKKIHLVGNTQALRTEMLLHFFCVSQIHSHNNRWLPREAAIASVFSHFALLSCHLSSKKITECPLCARHRAGVGHWNFSKCFPTCVIEDVGEKVEISISLNPANDHNCLDFFLISPQRYIEWIWLNRFGNN